MQVSFEQCKTVIRKNHFWRVSYYETKMEKAA